MKSVLGLKCVAYVQQNLFLRLVSGYTLTQPVYGEIIIGESSTFENLKYQCLAS